MITGLTGRRQAMSVANLIMMPVATSSKVKALVGLSTIPESHE
jgi:hypothetical protein